MKRTRLAAMLLLVFAASRVSAAGITFTEYLHRQNGWPSKSSRTGSVGIAAVNKPRGAQEEEIVAVSADAYLTDYSGVEEKEICLMEITRRACASTTTGAAAVGPGSEIWTSDLSCCKDHKLGYGGWNHGNHIGLAPFSQAIGSCDWTGVYPIAVTATAGPVVSPGVTKVGGVTAVCYLGADANECGFPSCDRMVLTLYGSYYNVAKVYSHWGSTNVNDATTTGNCQAAWTNRPSGATGNRVMDTNDTASAGGAAQPGARQVPAPQRQVPREFVAAETANYGGGGYGGGYDDYGYGGLSTTAIVYEGPAVIISGMVSSVVGKHKEHWDGGFFEYVPSFISTPVSTTAGTGLDATLPWIRDNSLKMTLYRSGGYYEGASSESNK